jgi:hypothetical protein
MKVWSVDSSLSSQEPKLDKSVVQIESPNVAVERRFKIVSCEKTGIKATFDRLRAQLAQEAEQRSRPASRMYSGFRAVKA